MSLRTIYRDIDALGAAGVPVHGESGAEGGYALLDGYRMRLNGLSPQEAEALFLSGLPGPVQALGLGAVMAGAQTRLLAAAAHRIALHRKAHALAFSSRRAGLHFAVRALAATIGEPDPNRWLARGFIGRGCDHRLLFLR